MDDINLRLLQYESAIWKHLLTDLKDENVELKIRLSKVLWRKLPGKMLEQVEDYQNQFLIMDELILLLRNEVVEMDFLLSGEVFENGKLKKNIDRKLKQLNQQILTMEEKFMTLKKGFRNFADQKVKCTIEIPNHSHSSLRRY